MTQTFQFVKVAAGEPFPFETGEYVLYDHPDPESYSDDCTMDPGDIIREDYYILRPLPTSPDVEGFIEKVVHELYENGLPQNSGLITDFMRKHFPAAPTVVTREEAEAWFDAEYPLWENVPGNGGPKVVHIVNGYIEVRKESALAMYDYLTTFQPSPIQVTRGNMSGIVTRQAAEDWILQWCENKPGDYVYDVKEAALALYDYLQSSQPQPVKEAELDAERVAEIVAECVGYWHSCSGCHETVEGQETGHNPYSKVFNCYVGSGCHECGGICISERGCRSDQRVPHLPRAER